MKQVRVAIGPSGNFKHIYDDSLRAMDKKLGRVEVHRASDVYFNNSIDQWCIRVDGHVLEETFDNRLDALKFEVRWLEANSLHG